MGLKSLYNKLFFCADTNWEESAKAQIKTNEGLRLKVYKCTSNKLTVGYGHNIEDLGITQATADFIFDEDFNSTIKSLNFVFGNTFFSSLPSNVKVALADMMFNLGINRFMGFKNFIKAIKNRDFILAGAEIRNSKAYVQCHNRYENIAKMIEE